MGRVFVTRAAGAVPDSQLLSLWASRRPKYLFCGGIVGCATVSVPPEEWDYGRIGIATVSVSKRRHVHTYAIACDVRVLLPNVTPQGGTHARRLRGAVNYWVFIIDSGRYIQTACVFE